MTISMNAEFREVTSIRPDKQGRFALAQAVKLVEDTLGAQADTYKVCVSTSGEILLVPVAEIPLRELWLHRNPIALNAVRRGLDQAARGEFASIDDVLEPFDGEASDVR